MADRSGPNGASPMRGRGAEFETVLGLLDSAAGPGPGLARRRRTGHREVAAAADVVLTGLEELASAGPVLVTADDV